MFGYARLFTSAQSQRLLWLEIRVKDHALGLSPSRHFVFRLGVVNCILYIISRRPGVRVCTTVALASMVSLHGYAIPQPGPAHIHEMIQGA